MFKYEEELDDLNCKLEEAKQRCTLKRKILKDSYQDKLCDDDIKKRYLEADNYIKYRLMDDTKNIRLKKEEVSKYTKLEFSLFFKLILSYLIKENNVKYNVKIIVDNTVCSLDNFFFILLEESRKKEFIKISCYLYVDNTNDAEKYYEEKFGVLKNINQSDIVMNLTYYIKSISRDNHLEISLDNFIKNTKFDKNKEELKIQITNIFKSLIEYKYVSKKDVLLPIDYDEFISNYTTNKEYK